MPTSELGAIHNIGHQKKTSYGDPRVIYITRQYCRFFVTLLFGHASWYMIVHGLFIFSLWISPRRKRRISKPEVKYLLMRLRKRCILGINLSNFYARHPTVEMAKYVKLQHCFFSYFKVLIFNSHSTYLEVLSFMHFLVASREKLFCYIASMFFEEKKRNFQFFIKIEISNVCFLNFSYFWDSFFKLNSIQHKKFDFASILGVSGKKYLQCCKDALKKKFWYILTKIETQKCFIFIFFFALYIVHKELLFAHI